LNDPTQATATLHELLPIFASMGVVVERLDEVLECSVPLSRLNRNHLGTMYAGVLWSAAEVLGGLLSLAHRDELGPCAAIVTEATIKFLKPATTAIHASTVFDRDRVKALKAALDGEGKAKFDLNIDLKDEGGVTVSTVVAWYVYRRA
jgi:thioesterase domain-containing protein